MGPMINASPGDKLTVVRAGVTGHVDARYTVTVARVTPHRLYLTGSRSYVERGTGIVKPKYIDYTTRVVAT
jgi:hypothetical protein